MGLLLGGLVVSLRGQLGREAGSNIEMVLVKLGSAVECLYVTVGLAVGGFTPRDFLADIEIVGFFEASALLHFSIVMISVETGV